MCQGKNLSSEHVRGGEGVVHSFFFKEWGGGTFSYIYHFTKRPGEAGAKKLQFINC